MRKINPKKKKTQRKHNHWINSIFQRVDLAQPLQIMGPQSTHPTRWLESIIFIGFQNSYSFCFEFAQELSGFKCSILKERTVSLYFLIFSLHNVLLFKALSHSQNL